MPDIIFGSRTVYDLAIAYNWGTLRDAAYRLDSDKNIFASDMAKKRNTVENDAKKAYEAVLDAVS